MGNPQIQLPEMCRTHQVLLVRQAGYRESDPWRSLLIGAQIALFQAATAHPGTHDRLGGDITKIGSIGCLACYRPDAFGEIVEAAQAGGLGAVKAVGDRWVSEAGKQEAR